MINRRLLATLAAAALASGCAGNVQAPVEQKDAVPEPVAETAVELPAPPDKSLQRITIAAVGDIMLGTDYPEDRLPDDDAATFLNAVAPSLQSADVAFGNLEGVLLDGGEPEKTCSNPAACYLFRTPTRYASVLADAGFTVMSLANNHAVDFGEAGRDASMAALQSVGIQHAGRAGDVARWTDNGISYAVIAFSPTKGSHDLLSYEQYLPEIARLADAADVLIVSFHGGAEGRDGVDRLGFGMEYAYGEKRGDVVNFSRAMVDAGADLVIGHGPHIPRALEVYNHRVIAYSLGNFATYYGISVAGSKGFAPMLRVRLDGTGRFVDGQVLSFVQRRPGGPVPDPKRQAARMIRDLSNADFPAGALRWWPDDRFAPINETEEKP